MESIKPKLNAMQVEAILDELIPKICKPEDAEFFLGVLTIAAENYSSDDFAKLINKMIGGK